MENEVKGTNATRPTFSLSDFIPLDAATERLIPANITRVEGDDSSSFGPIYTTSTLRPDSPASAKSLKSFYIGSKSTDDDEGVKENKKKKKKEKSVPVYMLFRFATKLELFQILIAVICSLGIGALQPTMIVIFGEFLDTLSISLIHKGTSVVSATHDLILTFVYLGTATLVAAYVAQSSWIMTGEYQTRRIRRKYVHSILRQDLGWFDMAEEESLTTRLAADTQLIQDGISERFGQLLQAISGFVAGVIIAFVKGWNLAIVILATIPVLAAVGGSLGLLISKFTMATQDAYAEAGSIAEQAFAGIRTVYSFSLQKRFSRLYELKLTKAREVGVRRGIVLGIGFGAVFFVLFCTFGLAFWYGGQLVIKGRMGGATVMVVFYSMIIGAMALMRLPINISAVSTASAAAFKIFSTIDRVPVIDPDNDAGLKPKKVVGELEFRNVKFSYPTRPDITILKNLSLKIKPGMTVAFVGPSGSGKSTGVQLLQRFYDPISGDVLLDGNNLKSLNVKWLRSNIGVVSQEPVLFNMTIYENLLMGIDHDITMEEVIEACKKANCHTFISQLSDGYDTLVGEHGGMLSGGQKQRIAIARAILKNPTILLLDEATSALDTQSERLVQRALDAAAANRTTIVIAHRLSTIRDADLIVVMDKGDIIEQGSHDELLALGGAYAELVKKQRIATKKSGGKEEEQDHFDEKAIEIQETEELRKKEKRVEEIVRNSKEDESKVEEKNLLHKESRPIIDAYEIKLQKEKELKKQRMQQKAPLRKILLQMRPEWSLMFFGLVGAFLSGAVFPCYSLIFSKIITILTIMPADEIAPGPMEGANLYAFIFVIFGIASLFSFSMQTVSFEVAGERYTERLRGLIFKAYLKQEIGYFDDEDHSMGTITSKLALDARNVNEMVTKVWGDVLQLISTVVSGLVIGFVYSWEVTLCTLTMSPFIVAGCLFQAKIELGYEDMTSKANEKSGEVAAEAIKEIRTVAALNKQCHFEGKFAIALNRPHTLAVRKAYLSSLGFALQQGIMMYVNAVAFYAGANFIDQGRIGFEQLMVSMMAVMMMAQGVGHASVFPSTFAKAKNSAVGAFEVLERRSRIDADLEGFEPDTVRGDVAFNSITFRYPARPDIPIFDGEFNLQGVAGKTIALVGPSGCGKSTTVGMLQRWYDPIDGEVSLDKQNVKGYTLANLRSHMALVGQEPVLFDMSIGENIRFGVDEEKEVTQEEVEAAAKAANIHQFITGLPDDYNTRVGDKGSQLSGGQKQRIAIARALIRKPKVLLLDEATSALDSESEKLVQAAIDNIISEGGRTTITIAHRLSTIQDADLICVVKDGRVVEQGTHWELLQLDGEYAALVYQQSLNAH